MKRIIEGLLEEFDVDYITENNLKNTYSSQIILFWDIDDEEKPKDFDSQFLVVR